MRDQAPPQFSPDGHWWWTGRRWIPVQQSGSSTWSQPQPAGAQPQPTRNVYVGAPRRRRTPGVLWLALIALFVLLGLALMPNLTSSVTRLFPTLGGLPSIGSTAPPATAPPTTTPGSGPGAAAAYQQMIATEVGRFQVASQAVADRCSPSALADGTASCRAALRSLDNTVQSIQSDLDAQQVPSCLQPADNEVRTALSLYHQGIQQELAGLDRDDPGAVVQGAGTLGQATAAVQRANSLLQNVSC